MKKTKILLFIFFATVCIAIANEMQNTIPQWWVDRGIASSVENQFTGNILEENYSVANIGQLMFVATQAATELNDNLQDGAGSEINDMIASFPDYDESNPDANYAALNVGQLKYVAQKFYDKLSSLETGSIDWNNIVLISGGTDTTNHKYPWTAMDNPPTQVQLEENYFLANIGQLKYLFSWSIGKVIQFLDSNGNGISDAWELLFFGNLNSVTDSSCYNGNGISDKDKFLQNKNPTAAPAGSGLVFVVFSPME